ncbi:MAG TPA: DsbA family protein [candidate division Zixibacteria bacterium]|nr:DsbA family protein [candidate division Zixibacteria bacterium]
MRRKQDNPRNGGRREKTARAAILAAWLLLVPPASVRAQGIEQTLAALGKQPALGPARAAVSIVEFSDFQCSFCKKFWSNTLPQLKTSYIKEGRARFVYRHFAVLGQFSEQAALAAECAGEQGRFWQYHDRLFANQGALAFTRSKLEGYAREIGLKPASFSQCLASGRHRKKIERETETAVRLGARGTPTFFVNSRLLVGAQPFEVFREVIEDELKRRPRSKQSSGM